MKRLAMALALGLAGVQAGGAAPQLQILLPLGRTAYQCNEQIDLAVVRSAPEALPADTLTLAVNGDDGSKAVCAFPVAAVAVVGSDARATEHLRLNGWLLRPGKYRIEVTANDVATNTAIEVYGFLRQSTFKLIDWGSRAQGADLAKLGEDGLGFNLIYGEYRYGHNLKNAEATLRGGADFMQCCTMSGAHQMDLRSECDWSDPSVIRGGTARVAQQAFINRTTPNCIGVHFYDEPGLTWWTHPKTGKNTPHNVPAQDRSFKSAFGVDPLQYCDVKPDNPADAARWLQWGRWKFAFMDAAWKDARFGVEQVDPELLSVTQSQYGFTAYADGYYFNVVRSLPAISGHGGYDDGPASYFYPSYHFEFGRVRDMNKPAWYLPAWYGGMSSDLFRLEQYLSFMVGLQGMAKPPDHQVHNPDKTSDAEGILESNRLMARLGTIFGTMPANRCDVALLYSMSQNLGAQLKDMNDNYEGGGHTRGRLLQAYLAGKMIHIPFLPVVEEDILDGTVAAQHKAIVLAGVNTLDPKVVAALEAYAAAGGAVLLTDDCAVQIKGAQKVGAEASMKQYNLMGKLWADKKPEESMRARAAGLFMKDAEPLAKALQVKLQSLGIKPAAECDNASIVVTRQGQGDVEYVFAVNATWDEQATNAVNLAIKGAQATLAFPADGRSLYDAVRGGPVAELKGGGTQGQFRFGAGQMRVVARTARPIGGVQVQPPVVFRDYTSARNPVRLTVAATVVDNKGAVLGGAVPLEIRVLDPLGAVRYDLYRATELGQCTLVLPLAANDPAGQWSVEVAELLSNTKGAAAFAYQPAPQCGALAGATPRAVSFGSDRERAFRFCRTQSAVTIVKGASPFNGPAAERLAEALKPWGVRCAIVNAADVNKPRELSPDEAKTWVGIEFGRADPDNSKNKPTKVGFALAGAAILLGNAADNPLIATVESLGFLPYKAGGDFPGRGRGMLAWQRDAIGIGQESITLIAYDEAGLSEAVGTLYEAAAGLDPLMPLVPPSTAAVTAASKNLAVPEAAVAWQAVVPDAAVKLTVAGNQAVVVTKDGTATTLDAAGRLVSGKAAAKEDLAAAREPAVVPEPLKAKLPAARVPKCVAAGNGLTAIGYWGGALQVFDGANALKSEQMLSQDIARMAWLADTLVVALADGRVVGLQVR